MINLAGVKDADTHITRELERARIPVVSATIDEIAHTEVPFTRAGQLGPFRFRRAWYYYVATGPVPIDLAVRLYEDPIGKTDIRSGGHCGCPSPLDFGVVWRHPASRKVIATLKDRAAFEQYAQAESGALRSVGVSGLAEYEFSEDPRAVGLGYVEVYHIDTEVGLRVFADAIREIP